MAYVAPFIPEFKAQFQRDFPYAVPLKGGGSGAILEPVVGTDGAIASVTVVSPGSGYKKAPTVLVYGGRGVGAVAGKPTLSGGTIASVSVASGGYGYSGNPAPRVYVSNGEGDNTDETKVCDQDIQAAFQLALAFNFSQNLFANQATYTQAACLLAAHYLVMNLAASNQGLAAREEWVVASKGAGALNETFHIPPRILSNPTLSKIATTSYGARFVELIAPLLIANIQSYHRDTLP